MAQKEDKTQELLAKVRKIEIKTRGLSHQIFAGEYHSAFKGRGMAVSEVLLIDISRSGLFGSRRMTKKDMLTEIAAVLSFSALINNDKVGALFFSDRVEKFIPPAKGRTHLLHIIREILQFEPQSNGTNLSEALRYLSNAIKKRCTAFLLSDLLDVEADGTPKYEDALKVAVSRHDLSVIQVYDPLERKMPDVGIIHVKDAESGQSMFVNTSSKRTRQEYDAFFEAVESASSALLGRYAVDSVRIATDEDYVKGLMSFFQKR